MKKKSIVVFIALFAVTLGLILQFMDMGVFGVNPIPDLTTYNQLFFWGGILIWAYGHMQKEAAEKEQKER